MNDMLKPLVVTPVPYKGESLLGLILRTAESNGYESPFMMLRYCGMNDNETRSILLPLDKLSKLYGRDPCDFGEVAHKRLSDSKYGNGYLINGNVISGLYLDVKRAKVCPECVREKGYCDVFWTFRHVIVCPEHGRALVDSCPSCGGELSWNRRGMLQCSCGCDLSLTKSEGVASENEVAFTSVLQKKLYCQPLQGEKLSASGLPLESLDQFSLNEMFGLIERIGRVSRTHGGKWSRGNSTYEIVKMAADAFCDWPNGFYAYLNKVAPSAEDGRGLVSYGISKQFSSFYCSMFKSGMPSDKMQFIRAAFAEYGVSHWKQAAVSKRLLEASSSQERKMFTVPQAARFMGVWKATVTHMIERGIVSTRSVKVGNKILVLVDGTNGLPRRISEGRSISGREAASVVGLPVSVLDTLRTRGVYKTRYFGAKVNSYHEYDVRDFKKNFLKKVSRVDASDVDSNDHISLSEVMAMKLGSADRKASVIEKVTTGVIPVYGRAGGGIGDVILFRESVLRCVTREKTDETGVYTLTEAGIKIGCSPCVAPWFVRNGYLRQDDSRGKGRITTESVDEFLMSYVTCASIAKSRKTSSAKVVGLFESYGVEVLWARRRNGNVSQPFIRQVDLTVLDMVPSLKT